jgi:peptidoglycan/LPS O-acetylase OafA/YrhL
MTFMAHVDEFMPYPQKLWSVFAMAWGWGLGVDVFFVLSGYLITRSLLSDIERASPQILKRFWIKRIYRIMPASIVWIILASVSAWLFLPSAPGGAGAIARSAFAAASNTMNFWFTYCADHQELNGYCGGMLTLSAWWSLSLEEQFYIVFPILMLAVRTRSASVVVCAIVAFYAFQHKAFFNLATSTRLEGISLGVLLAFASSRLGFIRLTSISNWLRRSVGLLALLSLVGTGTIIRFLPSYSLLLFFLAMMSCLFLVFLATRQAGVFDFGLPSRLLERLGKVSFSFYLCHESCLAFSSWGFKHLGYEPTKWYFLAYSVSGVILSSVVATITYGMIEKPFMERGHRKASAIIRRRDDRVDGQVSLSFQ